MKKKFSLYFKDDYWLVIDTESKFVYGKFKNKKKAYNYCCKLNY